MIRNLSEHDEKILERYWRSYRSYRQRLTNPAKESPQTLATLQRVTTGIEQTFNEVDEEMQFVIQTMYWNDEQHTWSDLAKGLHMSASTMNNKRKRLLRKTAENIGYI